MAQILQIQILQILKYFLFAIKLLVIIWNSLGPMYLSELLTSYVPSHELRSKSQNLLAIPKTNLNIGKRSFSVCGPHLWNSLPVYLRQAESLMSFKSGLKTFYFNKEYFNV